MTETEVLEFFTKGGQPRHEVEAMFQMARDAYRSKRA
jgi:hypothetical protein